MESPVNLEGNIYSCKHCKTHLALSDDVRRFQVISHRGWKSLSLQQCETADDESQKHKEGKCVLERNKILGPDESD